MRLFCFFLGVYLFSSLAPARADDPSSDLSHPEDLQAVAEPLNEGSLDPSLPLTLPDAVALALRQNPTVRLAALQRVVERFAVYVAYDRFKPHYTTDLRAGVGAARGPAALQDPDGLSVALTPHLEWLLPTGTFLSADLQANRYLSGTTIFPQPYGAQLQVGFRQSLLRDFGPQVGRATQRSAVARDGARKMAYASTLLAQLRQVIEAYRAYSQTSMQHAIAQKGVQRARDVLSNNEQMVAAGRLARADLVQVQADIASREANLAAAEAQRTAAQIGLAQLLALSPTTPMVPVPEAPVRPLSLSLEQARALALRLRPEYAAAVLTEAQAGEGVVLARNARRWDLALSGHLQSGGVDARALPALGTVGSGRSQAAFIGITLNTPLFDVNQDEPVVVARAQLAQARIARATTAINVALQADGALRNLHLQQRVYRLAVSARRLWGRNLTNEQEKLLAGRSSTFVVLRFVDNLVNAEGNEIAAQVALQNAVTAVEAQTGSLLGKYGIQPE